MAPPRLILVEGLPGSGKSTTAQRIWLRLEGSGRPARWWFEHELGHPVLDDEAVRAARRGGPGEALFARALQGWRGLAAQLAAGGGTAILEGTLFQALLGTQLLRDEPAGAIGGYFDRTAEILAPLAPALVRLRRPDAGAALRRACERRAGWFERFLREEFAATPRGRRLGRADLPALEDYFREREAIADTLTERFPGPRLLHDNSGEDWAAQNEAVAAFLGLPAARPRAPGAAPAAYAGRYRAETGDAWRVVADGEGLRLEGEAPARLLPLGADAFAIEGLCVELRFRRGPDGAAEAAECRGALPGLALQWRKVRD